LFLYKKEGLYISQNLNNNKLMKRKIKKTEKKLTLEKFTVAELNNPIKIMGGGNNDGTGDNNTATFPTGRKD
jgi:hypothetical protein